MFSRPFDEIPSIRLTIINLEKKVKMKEKQKNNIGKVLGNITWLKQEIKPRKSTTIHNELIINFVILFIACLNTCRYTPRTQQINTNTVADEIDRYKQLEQSIKYSN